MHDDPTRRMPLDDDEGSGRPAQDPYDEFGDTSPGSPDPEGGGMSTGQKVAIGLVAAVVIGLLIALIALAADGGDQADSTQAPQTTTVTTTSEPSTTSTTEPSTSTSTQTSSSTQTTTSTETTTETDTGGGSGGISP